MSDLPDNSEETKKNETAPATPQESLTSGARIEKPHKPHAVPVPPERQQEGSRKNLNGDFIKGLMGSLSVNAVAVGPYIFCLGVESYAIGASGHGTETNYLIWIGGLWMLVNLIIIIILAMRRREFLKGVVAGYAIAFLITIILGLGLTAFCLNPNIWG